MHREEEHALYVAPVLEDVADVAVLGPRIVVQTVVENQESTWIHARLAVERHFLIDLVNGHLLTSHVVVDDTGLVLFVNKDIRYELGEELVGRFSGAYHCAYRDVLVVKEQILDEVRLACAALADHDDDLVVLDFGDIKFLEFKLHVSCSLARLRLLIKKIKVGDASPLARLAPTAPIQEDLRRTNTRLVPIQEDLRRTNTPSEGAECAASPHSRGSGHNVIRCASFLETHEHATSRGSTDLPPHSQTRRTRSTAARC